MLICLNYGTACAEEVHIEPTPTADAGAANVAPGIVIIEGDRLQVYFDRKYKSIGNAALHRDNQDIYGDIIEYDAQNEELYVADNTRIETKDISLWGQELHLKLGENTGKMKDSSFQIKGQVSSLPASATKTTDALNKDNLEAANTPLAGETEPLTSQNIEDGASFAPTLKKQRNATRGDAKTILFEGQDKKRLIDARYTTCAADSDDWYIKAKEIELNDYTKSGTAKNARLEFEGVPLLYTPWISFSFLNQRQSGFLAPTVGSTSRSGFEVSVPYYWNFSPNLDATLTPRYFSKRGTQMQGEMRYLGENLDETYSGIDNIEYLPSDSITQSNRYYANLKHQQSFGNGWSASYALEKVSDDQYFSDLSTRITTTSRVALAQQGIINYAYDVWSFNGLVQRFQTLDNLSFPYERLPQLTLSADKDWGMVNTNLYSQWVNFDRNPNAPTTLLGTVSGGVLTTSVTGNRLTVYPSVSVSFAKPYGYITPKFGVNYTSYRLNNEAFTLDGVAGNYESDSRTLPIFSLDSGLYFDRDMRVVKNHYTQTLEPRLYYVYIPNKKQDNFPVFDSADSDLNLGTLFLENQFTGNDRINNANQLSLAVTTRMIDSKTGEQRLAATLGQRFYFTDQKVAIPGAALRSSGNSDIVAAVTARLTNKWNVDAAWQYNTDRSTTVKSDIGARFNPEPGKVLNLSYRFTENSLEQVNISGQWPLGSGWYGMGRWNYSIRERHPIEGLAGIEYDAGCWQARTVLQQVSTATASSSQSASNYAIFFQLELNGLTSIGSNPMTLLKRSVPGYTTSGQIPDSYQQQSYE